MGKSWSEKFNSKLKPITEYQKNYFIKRTQRNILIANSNGDGICMKCGSDVNIKAKHKDNVICPHCGEHMIAHHIWRTQQYPVDVKWFAMVKAMDNHTLCIRYIQCIGDNVDERGRIYIDIYRTEMEYWCHSVWQKEWTKGKSPFFVKPNVFNGWYTDDVYSAEVYKRTLYSECSKLVCFGKYNPIKKAYDETRMATQLHYLMRSAKINEMLYKSGFKFLAENHLNYYMYTANDHTYPINNKETELHKILKLSKHAFNVWKNGDSNIDHLKLQQKWAKKMTPERVNKYYSNYVWRANTELTYLSMISKLVNKSLDTIDGYMERKHVDIHDYYDYLKMLSKLEYNMSDKQYIMPRDFAKDKERICNEYNDYIARQKREKEAERDGLIKKVSDALRKMENLGEYLNGSKGLLVYIPESVNDLLTEGRALHNCIASYEQRIAQGKTMVFYIRQLSNPTAPFVAMEYCNGNIIQCRYDNNEDVRSRNDETSRNIIDFAEAFANTLRNNKVLVA